MKNILKNIKYTTGSMLRAQRKMAKLMAKLGTTSQTFPQKNVVKIKSCSLSYSCFTLKLWRYTTFDFLPRPEPTITQQGCQMDYFQTQKP
jgi:hypothetical protein